MKRVFSTMCLIAMVALVATSCKKKEEKASFNIGIEEVKGLEWDNDDAKAYVDGNTGTMYWNEGDQIVIYNLDAEDYRNSKAEVLTAVPGSEGKTSTNFEGPSVGGMLNGGFFYFYHAEKAQRTLEEGNREYFKVDAVQEFNTNTYPGTGPVSGQPNYVRFDPKSLVMACQTNSLYSSFTMQHIFGFLNIKFKATSLNGKNVKEIKVRDNKWNLTGDIDLKIGSVVNPSALREMVNELYNNGETTAYENALASWLSAVGYHAPNATNGKVITLNCKNLPASTKYFFISVRPGALRDGFDVQFEFTDGSKVNQHYAADKANTIRPGFFTNINFTSTTQEVATF